MDIYTAPVQNDWIDIIVKICRIFFFGPIIKRHVIAKIPPGDFVYTFSALARPLAHSHRARVVLYAGSLHFCVIWFRLRRTEYPENALAQSVSSPAPARSLSRVRALTIGDEVYHMTMGRLFEDHETVCFFQLSSTSRYRPCGLEPRTILVCTAVFHT